MLEIVVAEDRLVAARLAHALDHRVVVERVREDQAVRDQLGERRDAGLIRDVARGEDEGRFLAVEIGELGFERHDGMAVAGDVAGAAGAGAEPPGGLDHGAGHVPVLAHAEIVVGAPHRDRARAVRGMPDRLGIAAGQPLDIGKNAVAPLGLEAIEGRLEEVLIIHHLTGWAMQCPGIVGPLCQIALIRVKVPSRDIAVESRLRSLYLIKATMGRVNHD